MDWVRQTNDQPLFPDLLWSRPENKRLAGKLLIVGGNSYSFAAVSNAYAAATAAGIGATRVIVPDSLRRILQKTFPEAEFAPSTPSGSFGRQAVAELLDAAQWADGVLLAGGFGKNSETAILLEGFIKKYRGCLVLTHDSLDYLFEAPGQLLDRPKTVVMTDFGKLQKLLSGRLLLKHSMSLVQVVEALANFSANCSAAVIASHSDQVVVASEGRVSTTPAKEANFIKLAAYSAVWMLQQPVRTFEALSTSIFCYSSAQT